MTGISSGQISAAILRQDGYRTATANERLVLDRLRVHGSISQAELARATGLTPQSVMRITDALSERDMLVEGAPVASGRGKPSTPLRLNPQAAFSVGLSIMTDAVALVIMDLSGAVCHTARAVLADVLPEKAIVQMRGMIDAAVEALAIPRERIVGAGIGVTGYFVDATARVNPPKQLEPWALIPLDTLLTDGLGMPVWIDNDGNVAAVGEAMIGAGRVARSFAYLYFSAGFGGGLFVDGRPVRGRSGNAGEFASILPLDWPQPNLEQLRLSVNAAGARFADLNQLLAEVTPDLPGVETWMEGSARSLNLVISAISAILDPDLIVFGGRIPKLIADALIPRLQFVNPPRRDHLRPVPQIVTSSVVFDAAATGAASMPLRSAFF